MADLALNILIKTVTDTTGIKLTTEQATKLKTALADAGDASKTAGVGQDKLSSSTKESAQSLGELSRTGREGVAVLRGIDRASQGGMEALFGITEATRGFIGLVRTALTGSGALGVLAAAIGVIGGAFLALRNQTQAATETQGDFSTAVKKASDAVAELNEKRLTKLKEDLEHSVSAVTSLYKYLLKVSELQGQRKHAEADAELAAIDANPKLTPLEKATQSQAVKDRVTKDDRKREDDERQLKIDGAQKEFSIRLIAADAAKVAAASAKAHADALTNDKITRDDQIVEMEKQLDAEKKRIGKEMVRLSVPGAAGQGEGIDFSKQFALEAQLSGLKARQAVTGSEDFKAHAASAEKAAADAKSLAGSQETAADAAFRVLVDAWNESDANREVLPGIRRAQNAKTSIENRTALGNAADATAAGIPRKDALSLIHGLPGERDPREEGLAADRAIEINKRALAEPGRQAGETMAEAVAQAIHESFPTITQSFAAALNRELRGLDDKISREIAQIRSQANDQQSQLKAQRN